MEHEIRQEIEAYKSLAGEIVIKDDETFIEAHETLKRAKIIEKRVGEFIDPIIKKAYETHKEAVGQKKTLLQPLTDAVKKIRLAVGKYQAEKEEIARRKAREEQARLQKIEEERRLEEAEALANQNRKEEAEAVLSEPVWTPPPVVETPPKTEGVSYRESWRFAIQNPNLVPREYCVPDEKAIGAIVRAMKGNARIPGVQVFCEKIPVVK